ncbi:hypothetical protein BOP96_15845 [Pseudomonas sp. FSL W5-0203]|nr:hypothetical protein CFT9_05870 [Pseudomonas sp. CFT9]OJT29375.1 hypothetical protein BOP96_15845 [Pseudomonas sp. FSL W5-0203]
MQGINLVSSKSTSLVFFKCSASDLAQLMIFKWIHRITLFKWWFFFNQEIIECIKRKEILFFSFSFKIF